MMGAHVASMHFKKAETDGTVAREELRLVQTQGRPFLLLGLVSRHVRSRSTANTLAAAMRTKHEG